MRFDLTRCVYGAIDAFRPIVGAFPFSGFWKPTFLENSHIKPLLGSSSVTEIHKGDQNTSFCGKKSKTLLIFGIFFFTFVKVGLPGKALRKISSKNLKKFCPLFISDNYELDWAGSESVVHSKFEKVKHSFFTPFVPNFLPIFLMRLHLVWRVSHYYDEFLPNSDEFSFHNLILIFFAV